MTKPLIQQLAERANLGAEFLDFSPKCWTSTALAKLLFELCAYLDERDAKSIGCAPYGTTVRMTSPTALAELREVPGATSANAGRTDLAYSAAGEWKKACLEARSALAASEARVQQLTGELAWEKAWDLHRKADMQAVVEAARPVVTWYESLDVDVATVGHEAISELGARLSALDARVEPVGEREPPAPPQERVVVPGSTWRVRDNSFVLGYQLKVTGFNPNNGWVKTEGIDCTLASEFNPRFWHRNCEWISDPATPEREWTPEERDAYYQSLGKEADDRLCAGLPPLDPDPPVSESATREG